MQEGKQGEIHTCVRNTKTSGSTGLIRFRQTVFVTYVTAGFPTPDETVKILLGMEAGGAGYCTSDYRIVVTIG